MRKLLFAAAAFGPAFLCVAACDSDSERRADEKPLAGWSGPPPRIALVVTGPEADEDKRERCAKLVASSGGIPDPGAPVQAVLTLRDDGNRLQVISRARGMLRDEPRPGWSTERLCNDAIGAAAQAIRQEFGAPPGYGVAGAGAPDPGAPPGPPPPAPPPVAGPPSGPPPALVPLPASAPKAAAELAARGTHAYQRGDFAGALGAFSAALHISADPPLLFDAGASHYMLGQPQQAAQLVQLYLDRAPKAPNRAQAEALLAQLHHQLGNDE